MHASPFVIAAMRYCRRRPQVDAVVITVTSGAHHAAILAAAAAGKHVFVEKPLALTAAGSLECAAACAAAGVLLQVGFMRRFDTDVRRVRDLVAAGAVGAPQIVRVRSFDGIKQPTPYYASRSAAPPTAGSVPGAGLG